MNILFFHVKMLNKIKNYKLFLNFVVILLKNWAVSNFLFLTTRSGAHSFLFDCLRFLLEFLYDLLLLLFSMLDIPEKFTIRVRHKTLWDLSELLLLLLLIYDFLLLLLYDVKGCIWSYLVILLRLSRCLETS